MGPIRMILNLKYASSFTSLLHAIYLCCIYNWNIERQLSLGIFKNNCRCRWSTTICERYFYYTTLFDTAVPVVKKTSLFCISYGLKCANMWHYSTVPSRSEILLMYKLHSMIFTMHWSCKTILKGTFVCSNFSTLGGKFRPPCYIFWVTSQIL
jgi:hypothetical protein